MAATPELTARLKTYVSGGAGSTPSTGDAFIAECISEAVALVDNWTSTKYVPGAAPVAPVTVALPELSAYASVTTLPNYDTVLVKTAGKISGTAELTRTGNLVSARYTVTWVFPEPTGLPAHIGTPNYSWGTPYISWPGIVPEAWRPLVDSVSSQVEGDTPAPLVMNTGDVNAHLSRYMYRATPVTQTYETAWLVAPVEVQEPISVRVSSVPNEVLERAYIEVGADLFYRKQAPQGISQFTSVDGSAIRLRRDPLDAVRPMLAPYLPGGFA